MTEIICDVKPNMLHSPSSGDVRKEAETLKSDIASLQQQIDNTDDFELRRQLRARVKQKRERLKELGEDDYIAPSLGRDMTSPSRQTSLLVRKMQDSIIAKQQGQGQGASLSSASVSKATVGRSQSLLVRKTCAADALSPPAPAAGGGRMGLIFKELYVSAKDRPLPEFRHMPPASPPPSFTNPFRSRAALQQRQSQDVTSSPSTLMTSSSSSALPVGSDHARTDGAAATLVRPLADVRAEDGGSGTFSCRCRPPPNVPVDDPLPTVTWVKDGHTLTISDDQFIQTIQREANNDFSISFVIREIFPDDEGKYTCTITGVAWQLTSTACLTVLDYETMMREKNKKMTNGASPSHHATNGHHDASCKSDVSGSADHGDDSKVKVEPRAAVKPVARGAMRAFSMDTAASSAAGTGTTKPGAVTAAGGGGTKVCRVVQRSQSDIKQMLLNWIQAQTKEYTNVDIKNFSTCWNDGLAFCALIHHFYPDAFDYSKLDSKNPEKNFQLAFDTAEKRAGIAPLLDVDDMMKMRTNPDWKCIFVYVQSFYRRFYRQTVAKSGSGEGSEGPSTPTTPHTPLSPSGSTSSEN